MHLRILPHTTILASYTMSYLAPLTVGHPFKDTHPRTSRALRRYPWSRVLGQCLYSTHAACSLRDATPSQCLFTTYWRQTSQPPSPSGIPEGKESTDHTVKGAAAPIRRLGLRVRRKGRFPWEASSTCPCHGCETLVCVNES